MKILVIRRDNIGDLVCTTPLINALSIKYPGARIDALVNSYNAPVLINNPDLKQIFVYTKAKHRLASQSILQVYWERLKLIAELRKIRYDYAILASAGFSPRPLRFAKLIAPKNIIGFTQNGGNVKALNKGIPYISANNLHEVQDIFRLLETLGIVGEPPAMKVVPQRDHLLEVDSVLSKSGIGRDERVIGIHISARKASNRWPVQKFIDLIQTLHARHNMPILLFWSPGSENNRLHPGDDEKANLIIEATKNVKLIPQPTSQLDQLIAGLARCQSVVCSDGGAMHIAAALGCTLVCFFGGTDSTRWYPWKAKHVLLQPSTKVVKDITVEDTYQALLDLNFNSSNVILK